MPYWEPRSGKPGFIKKLKKRKQGDRAEYAAEVYGFSLNLSISK